MKTAMEQIEALEALEWRLAYRQALEAIRDCDIPRPVAVTWRKDGTPSDLDRCAHDATMREDCHQCLTDFINSVLA